MPIPRRAAAALVAVACLASACTTQTAGHGSRLDTSSSTTPTSGAPTSSAPTSGSPLPAPPVPAPIKFRDCTQALEDAGLPVQPALKGKLRVGCGTVAVPLDYAHPDGTTIRLTVVRFHDTANTASPAPALFMNPGGPGAPAVEFALEFMAEIPISVISHFDLIGFDPRGVEFSAPVHCVTDKQKDAFLDQAPEPTTPAGFTAAKQLAADFANDCAKAVGSSLPFYNTANTARDMDQIRQAIGAAQMNYLGFSYGTELGWAYAHLFPSRVHAFVLDGAVDPDTTPLQQLGEQVQGFETAFGQFEQYCKTVSPCDQLSDPRRTAEQITSAARSAPLSTGSDRKLTVGLAFTGLLESLYSKQLWPQLANGLIGGVHGDGSALLQLADQYNRRQPNGTFPNILDANTTINCNDFPAGPTDTEVHQLAAEWAQKYPLFGAWQAGALFTCQQWQPQRTPVPKPQAATPTKVLVVGNLHDPATPYLGAQDLTRDLGNAELLSWNGQGHTSYLHGSSCIDDYVNRYLTTLALPPDHTTCPAQ